MTDSSQMSRMPRLVRATHLPAGGMPIRFRMGEAEREALAVQLKILAVDSFEADVTATAWRRDGVAVRGWLKAVIAQESVVTLEPVRQSIEERVDLTFIPQAVQAAPPRAEDGAIELDPEGDDLPDVFEGDSVDLDAALHELLALAIDPYPREPTESFEGAEDEEPEDDAKVSPFAVLASLTSKKSEG